jgi:hypothetical protein
MEAAITAALVMVMAMKEEGEKEEEEEEEGEEEVEEEEEVDSDLGKCVRVRGFKRNGGGSGTMLWCDALRRPLITEVCNINIDIMWCTMKMDWNKL